MKTKTIRRLVLQTFVCVLVGGYFYCYWIFRWKSFQPSDDFFSTCIFCFFDVTFRFISSVCEVFMCLLLLQLIQFMSWNCHIYYAKLSACAVCVCVSHHKIIIVIRASDSIDVNPKTIWYHSMGEYFLLQQCETAHKACWKIHMECAIRITYNNNMNNDNRIVHTKHEIDEKQW